jgi:hypothetical protein
MLGASIAVVSSRIRKDNLMARAGWVTPILTLHYPSQNPINREYTNILHITKIRNFLFRMHTKKLFIHSRFGSSTNNRDK